MSPSKLEKTNEATRNCCKRSTKTNQKVKNNCTIYQKFTKNSPKIHQKFTENSAICCDTQKCCEKNRPNRICSNDWTAPVPTFPLQAAACPSLFLKIPNNSELSTMTHGFMIHRNELLIFSVLILYTYLMICSITYLQIW